VDTPDFDIYPLIAQGMGPELHWFVEDVPLAELAAAMAAMANTTGGKLFLGINPRSGQIAGIKDLKPSIDQVFQACLVVDPTLVIPVPKVRKVSRTEILEITIPEGLPHVYSLQGRYYHRQGKRTSPIPARQLRRLLVERGMVPFESRLPPGVSYEDLDPEQIETFAQGYFSAVKINDGETDLSIDDLLLQRGILKQDGDEIKPTYAALLLFGRTPQRWLPAAHILAARFSDVTFGDQFIKQELNGSLIHQLQQAEQFLSANLQSVVRLIGFTHQEAFEYPFEAVRELIVNAIAHRDYNVQGDSIHLNIFSDHLEVTSPGELPGPINLTNIYESRFSRNPVIVQVLSDLGYVERLGYGLDRVVTMMRGNSLPAPRLEEVARTFRVTLFNSPTQDAAARDISQYQLEGINPRQSSALNYLGKHRRITNREYQELCPEVHPETLRRDFADLVARGILIKIGEKRATYYILK
jgi:ATP-dependent DNA helicase RecG